MAGCRYIKQRGYDLHSVEQYGALLEGAGFVDVIAEDRTWQVSFPIPSFFSEFEDVPEPVLLCSHMLSSCHAIAKAAQKSRCYRRCSCLINYRLSMSCETCNNDDDIGTSLAADVKTGFGRSICPLASLHGIGLYLVQGK